MAAPINITGHKFGDLTVLSRAGGGKRGTKWRCVCACGKDTTAYTRDLQHGGRVSCGCRRPITPFGNELWTAAKDAALAAHWAAKLSTAAIGAAMGITKNSVIGRARRLGLEGRPSPIGVPGPLQSPRPARVGKVTLPQLPATKPPAFQFQRKTTAAALNGLAGRDLDREEIGDEETLPIGEMWRALRESPVVPRSRSATCCWPIGEPGTTAFRFCDAPDTAPGKPYCVEHCSRAYTRASEVNTFVPIASGIRR